MFGGDYAGAIGVGKDEVVEFGNEAHGRGGIGRWPRGAREVEEFLAFFVLEYF